jgi:hypothetical protein
MRRTQTVKRGHNLDVLKVDSVLAIGYGSSARSVNEIVLLQLTNRNNTWLSRTMPR